ncbi:uncharacterized protein LOC143808682 [Ranitomeya variabilis]|uniref:uncharacterized protein LOC143808682 n=1 Tax=Ranitomeya variabilis TaxID=490064 RepID=UPI004055DF9B
MLYYKYFLPLATPFFFQFVLAVFCTGFGGIHMDYKAKEKAWLGQVEQVFGGSVSAPQSDDRKWEDLRSSIQDLLIKRTKLWWNRAFLERYVAANMIPRGLRVRVIPTFPVEDAQFVSNWEDTCSTCSLALIKLLINLNSNNICELDKLIDSTQSELRSGCPAEKITIFDLNLEKTLDSVVKKIHESQINKFNRDQRDYQQHTVYLWRKAKTSQQRLKSVPSVTSISSLSEQSDTSSYSIITRSGVTGNRARGYHPYKRRTPRSPDQLERDNKVINLSNHVLSPSDLSLLSRGLSFSPVAGIDTFSVIKDLHLFARSVLFKRYFFDDNLHQLFPTEEEQDTLRILEELSSENIAEGVLVYVGLSFGHFRDVLSIHAVYFRRRSYMKVEDKRKE